MVRWSLHRSLCSVALLLTARNLVAAEAKLPITFSLTLQQAESQALANSLDRQRSESTRHAAAAQLEASKGLNYPQLSFEASYRYLSEIPEAVIGPKHLPFGQHHNYTIGPALTYQLYDGGNRAALQESSSHVLRSRAHESAATRSSLLLTIRQTYGRVLAAGEELSLLSSSLHTLRASLADMRSKLAAGGASRAVLIVLERQEAQLQLKALQAQGRLADEVQQLATLIGRSDLPSPLRPALVSSPGHSSDNLQIQFDSLAAVLAQLTPPAASSSPAAHPQLRAAAERSAAAMRAADAELRILQPRVQLFAQSMYQYPNGPLDEQVWQHSAGLAVSVPLYDGGSSAQRAAAKRAEAQTNHIQNLQLNWEFDERWQRAITALAHLQREQELARKAIALAEEQLRMTAANRAAGSATALDLHKARSEVLEVRTVLARLQHEQLATQALLLYLNTSTELSAER